MQYSFNNSQKITKLTEFISGIYNNFYYKILGYFLERYTNNINNLENDFKRMI